MKHLCKELSTCLSTHVNNSVAYQQYISPFTSLEIQSYLRSAVRSEGTHYFGGGGKRGCKKQVEPAGMSP